MNVIRCESIKASNHSIITNCTGITVSEFFLRVIHLLHFRSVLAATMIPPFLWTTWRYSNAPEGQRPFEKIFGLSKYGFCGSVVMGLYDCALFTRPQTFWTSVNCISYWVVPVTAMCATFASVAYTSAKLREKDDYFNYAVACT